MWCAYGETVLRLGLATDRLFTVHVHSYSKSPKGTDSSLNLGPPNRPRASGDVHSANMHITCGRSHKCA